MPDEQYFAYDALSQSTLKRYLESPYKAKHEVKEIALESQRYGHALETLLFEGIEAIHNNYFVSKYKTYCDSMQKEIVDHKTPITQTTYDQLISVHESLKYNATARNLIKSPGELQMVLLWEQDGVLCKAKS